MRLLALLALLLGAALGCRGAEAQTAPAGADAAAVTMAPPTFVTIPPDWRALPDVAAAGEAAARAAAGTRAVTHVRTWGEPGLGCFVTIVDVTGAREVQVAQVADELRGVLAATLALDDWSATDGASLEVAGAIARGAMRGRVRGRLVAEPAGAPHAAIAACFYNEREPARCQDACTRLLATLEAPRVTP